VTNEFQRWLEETSEQVTGNLDQPGGLQDIDYSKVEIFPQKVQGYIQIPEEFLMDEGVIPDTRPKPPKPTWRPRFYWWRSRKKEALAYWIYEKLTGRPVPDPDDYR